MLQEHNRPMKNWTGKSILFSSPRSLSYLIISVSVGTEKLINETKRTHHFSTNTSWTPTVCQTLKKNSMVTELFLPP